MAAIDPNVAFSVTCGSEAKVLVKLLSSHHKWRDPAQFGGFVLNAPLSSAIWR
jgi:hypothetical protein